MSIRDANALLIVDDDRSFGAMLGWAFEDLGYDVELAGSCREAVEQARAGRFSFALVDYGLPDGNGQQLSMRLASHLPGLAVIIMSADRAGALAGMGGPPAARALLQKPFAPVQAHALFREGNAAMLAQS